jgi:predicted nucleotidyltransferase
MKKVKNNLMDILKEVLEKDENILFAYLYGSYVHKLQHLESDIDVGVYLRRANMDGYLRKEKELTGNLIAMLQTDKIDLRVINTAPFLLQYQIIKEGMLIFVRDLSEKVDFETRVMNRFFELKPYLEEYKQMLSSKIESGL